MPESFQALRRANPRNAPGFAESVDAVRQVVRAQIAVTVPDAPRSRLRVRRPVVGMSAASIGVIAAAAVFLVAGPPGGGPGTDTAAAAFRRAATLTAASAETSGSAVVRITEGGKLWAGTTVGWYGDDLAVSRGYPQRNAGSELRVVDGMMYGLDVDGGWVELGSPESIDPDSGTTPADYLAAVREDVGGTTLRRITRGMAGLATSAQDDGSTVYRGTVAAGQIARETGFKEGQAIRVLPFGYVAHDEAADPAAPLDVAVTVGPGGVVREIVVSWGTGASAWVYTVSYSGLGTTAPIIAPANARPLREALRGGKPGR